MHIIKPCFITCTLKRREIKPIRPTPLRTNRPIATSQTQISQMYNQPPPEVEQAYLPAEPGVLPLIV